MAATAQNNFGADTTGRSRNIIKYLITMAFVAFALILVGCSAPSSKADSALEVEQETPGGFGENTIIDVRTAEEFAAGHLEGALNLDIQSVDFTQRIAQLDPAESYVVYCRSGNRSGQAITQMRSVGFTDLVNGGGLQEAANLTGLPIVTD